MLDFESPKKCAQGREGSEAGQELIRDLLVSFPHGRVQSRQQRGFQHAQAQVGSTPALSAERCMILCPSLAWRGSPPDVFSKCLP